MTELTNLKLQAAALQLELEQRTNPAAPQPGQCTCADYAARGLGLSESTVRKLELTARAKIAAALLADPEIPPYLAKKLSNILTPKI